MSKGENIETILSNSQSGKRSYCTGNWLERKGSIPGICLFDEKIMLQQLF